MNYTTLPLDALKPASLNVRKRGGKQADDLMPSIRSLGLLQPLIVRPKCTGYEVVAGQRRYQALTKLAETGEGLTDVPCVVMDKEDDAKAIEASLAENLARLPMDEIDQYKAFAALKKQGLSVEDIASRFAVTTRMIEQRLAIANLIGPILTAYRKDEISASTVRVLTMASTQQQKAWWALFKDEDSYAPQGRALRAWLFGGEDIPVENALFDVAAYEGAIVSDLFSEDRFFDDADAFWTLQNQAIAASRETHLEDGWQEVTILDVGSHWSKWQHVKMSKKEGGRVYIVPSHNGAVALHEGYLTEKEAAKREKAKAGDTETKTDKPELTKALQTYLDLHRHAVVRHKLLAHPQTALRIGLAQMIAGSSLWDVRPDKQKAGREDIAESLEANTAQIAFNEERRKLQALLGIEAGGSDTLTPQHKDWNSEERALHLYAKLTQMSDEEVMRLLVFVVAECLPSGGVLVEALGFQLDASLASHWSPDDTFFDLLKDKEAINAILKEVGGKATADAHVSETAKLQKKLIRQHLDGSRKPHKPDWQPRYASFPMKAYTKRGGIEAIERAKAVEAALGFEPMS
ncbi:MAG: ParB/RepB/Spo0J family partition protein [Hyphomicrobiales bacterium]